MKKSVFVIVGCLMAVPVYAQQQQQPEFNIKLTGIELDLIGEGLGTQPFNKAAPLIAKLREQVIQQQKPVELPKATEEGKDK